MKRIFALVVLVGCGSSVADPPPPQDAAADVDPSTCFQDTWSLRPALKSCATNDDCVTREHQDDCCGSLRWVGVTKASAPQFDACEPAHRAAVPKCRCAANPTKAEDGKDAATLDAVAVRCASDKTCKTYVK